MEIKQGQRYILKDGSVTGKLIPFGYCSFKFFCNDLCEIWTKEGFQNTGKVPSSRDIVCEYNNDPLSININL